MAESIPKNLRLWERTATPVVVEQCDLNGLASRDNFAGQNDLAKDLFVAESLGTSSSVAARSDASPPYSLQWYLDVERLRHRLYGRWIPSVLEFTRHKGERLLGLGEGLGTDWIQYAKHGASVLAGCGSKHQLALVRRNFELRGLQGSFVHLDAMPMPLEPASIDVVCISSLPTQFEFSSHLANEVFRVLKPGGKVLAVLPARYDVDFWCRLLVPWHYWWGRWRRPEQRSPQLYSRRALRRLFTGFVETRIHKRHLRRGDVPHPWRLLSRTFLQRIVGRRLILKAFKPLSAAISVPLAA